MTTAPMMVETSEQPRVRGFALAAVLAGLMLTLFLEALDQTIVGTALPRIIAELHGLDRYSWVVTAYILASMTMIPIVGKLSDQFGRKWFLLAGTLLFLLGSMLAGASQTMNQLIAFRAVQGQADNDAASPVAAGRRHHIDHLCSGCRAKRENLSTKEQNTAYGIDACGGWPHSHASA